MPAKTPWPETADIVDWGMGPAIRGTRLVMTDIYQMLPGRTVEDVAAFYRLPVETIRSAVAYIEANRVRVEADMRAIREREAKGNPPALEEKLRGSRDRLMARKRELEAQAARRSKQGVADARAAG